MNKNYSNSFKFKVVLEVIKGDSTITEIMSKYQISKSVIHKWKKHFLEKGSETFGTKSSKDSPEDVNIEKLHATIGKLKVENDFLQGAWKKLQN
jgi:transposase